MNEKVNMRGFSFGLEIYFTQFVKLRQNGIMVISADLTTCDQKLPTKKMSIFIDLISLFSQSALSRQPQ